mgnify:CR=1 FL=1
MTNNPVNHATPAGFYAHNDSRYGYYEISRELAESGFEFFGGSGFYQFKGRKGDQEPVGKYIEEKGYEVIDLQILNNKVIITYKQYDIQTTMKLDLNNLETLPKIISENKIDFVIVNGEKYKFISILS